MGAAMSGDVLFPELEPEPPVRGDWFVFDDDGFPFAIGNGEYVSRQEMVQDYADKLARIEYVTDPDERRRLLNIHAGIVT